MVNSYLGLPLRSLSATPWHLLISSSSSMALLLHLLSFLTLFLYGLHHLISATRAHLKSPHQYSPQLYRPLSLSSFLRHTPFCLLCLFLLLSSLHLFILSTPTSLKSSIIIFLFIVPISLSFLHIPNDLSFLVAAVLFALKSYSSIPRDPDNDLPALCELINSQLSLVSSSICISLVVFPKLFLAEVALAGSLSLHGLWSLQTGLFLNWEAFIPKGCHKMIEGSVKCELQESRSRAAEVLDLAFSVYAGIIAVLVVVVYLGAVRINGHGRNSGSYEAISTSSSGGAIAEVDLVQMKVVGKSSMQA